MNVAPGGPEGCFALLLCPEAAAPGGRYLPGPASSGAASAREKLPEPLVACGGRYGAGGSGGGSRYSGGGGGGSRGGGGGRYSDGY